MKTSVPNLILAKPSGVYSKKVASTNPVVYRLLDPLTKIPNDTGIETVSPFVQTFSETVIGFVFFCEAVSEHCSKR